MNYFGVVIAYQVLVNLYPLFSNKFAFPNF